MAATKRTPEIEAAIVASVRNGAFPKHAAEACGVSKTAIWEWCHDGPEGARGAFGERIARAKAEALNESVNIIRGSDDWRARAWWAERMAPDELGDRQKLEVSGGLSLEQILAKTPKDTAK